MSWDLQTDTHPKANKKHNCDECGRVINKGEVYLHRKGRWEEDEWITYKLCLECEKLWDDAYKFYDKIGFSSEEILIGVLKENLEEDGFYDEGEK